MTTPRSHLVSRANSFRWKEVSAFTLVELLVASSVLAMVVLLLSSVLSSSLEVFRAGRAKSELRESARSVMELMSRELRQVVLPLDPTDSSNLEFTINSPDLAPRFHHRDTIFWQAPVANHLPTGSLQEDDPPQEKGDLAIVGYFIRNDGGRYRLCRVFINPGEVHYKIYSDPTEWLTDEMLDAVAPADEVSFLKGLVLENVPGMWVTAYQDATTPFTSYHSRIAGRLPSHVEISLVLLDAMGARLLEAGLFTLPAAASYSSAEAYIAALPERGRKHALAVSFSVSLKP